MPEQTAVTLDDARPGRPREARPAEAVVDLGASPFLPRMEASFARALNRLHDHRAASLSVSIGETSCLVHWVHGERPPTLFDVFRFRLGSHAGWLGLDVPAVAAILGEPQPLGVPRPLRCVLVADALSSCTHSLMQATRLHFEWLADELADAALTFDDLTAVHFRVEGVHWSGALKFDTPADLDALAPPRASAAMRDNAVSRSLRLPLRFEIGTTRIRLAELRGIAAGDLIAIEEWRSAGSAIVVNSVLRGGAGPVFVALAEGLHITIHQMKEQTMNRPTDSSTRAPRDAVDPAVDRLDGLEVVLRFEVGNLTLSLGELRHLRAGHVFELGQPLNRGPVRILADGNVLGKGTLVAVGDQLGVRISEFASGEL